MSNATAVPVVGRDRKQWASIWRAALEGDLEARRHVAPSIRCPDCTIEGGQLVTCPGSCEGRRLYVEPETRAEVRAAWRRWKDGNRLWSQEAREAVRRYQERWAEESLAIDRLIVDSGGIPPRGLEGPGRAA